MLSTWMCFKNICKYVHCRQTSLHWSSRFGNETMVQCLLDAGADVNAATSKQVSPLILACEHGHLDVVKLLVDKGANIEHKDCHGCVENKSQ